MVDIAESWSVLREEIDSRSRRLATEVAGAWSHVELLSQMLRERLQTQDLAEIQRARVESLESLFGGLAARLLFEPVALYRKKLPLFSVVAAIQGYGAGLDGVVQRLPVTCEISGRVLVALAGAGVGPGWRRHWLHWQRQPREVPFRSVVSGHLQRHILRRGRIDGRFQLVLSQACLHLLGPWQMHREHALKGLSGTRGSSLIEGERRLWGAKTQERAQEMARILAAYGKWANSASSDFAAAMVRSWSEPSRRARERRSELQQRRVSYWARQQRSVDAIMDLEQALAALAADVTGEGSGTLKSIQAEHEQLLGELAAVIEWLEAWTGGKPAGAFPPPQVRLISAEEYAQDWGRQVREHARSRLPAAVEVVEPRNALPGRRRPWRDLEPGKAFARALENLGTPRLITGFHEAVASHPLVMREIERAREVVAFGEDTARAEGLEGQAVAREAVGNALSLLLYQRETAPEVRPAAEAGLVQAEARVLLECHIALDKGRVGLLAHLTHQRGLDAVARARELFLAGLRGASRKTWLLLRRLSDLALVKIGWLAPPRPRLEPVSQRADLGHVLDLQFRTRDMPMIYRRLFRLTPIEEPRFLVGRETEMAGLSEALERWNSGMPASVVVVGARGSGKTSLLNCAASILLSGLPVVRGQLSARVTTADQMRILLRNILQLPEATDLARALNEKRRVVIIEEFERSFLREINGFEALRDLLTLIYETSSSTLWIFSVNETAFRYLDAFNRLGRHFSHRINAMSVKRDDLIGAILQRHDLSGLRLEFAPLPEEDRRVSRARRLLGLEQDPERLFFESLYRQSEGIFRSAFELWQGSIERVEGGVVHMRQPLVADYGPLLSELSHEDHFILQAILQHGGLTVDEVARVTRSSADDSGRRLERLRLIEILGPEPDYPGLRVRPEAGLFVREALHRQNLW
jgi:predicted AAA+ superfamily ATPase